MCWPNMVMMADFESRPTTSVMPLASMRRPAIGSNFRSLNAESPTRTADMKLLTVAVGEGAHDCPHPPVAHDGQNPLDVGAAHRSPRARHPRRPPRRCCRTRCLPVEREHPRRHAGVNPSRHRITTERSTSPWCIRSKAASTSSSLISSVTNASRSSRPCR